MDTSIRLIAGDGKTREINVRIELDPGEPALSAETIVGRLASRPTPDERYEIMKQAVRFEEREYKFSRLEQNGEFELEQYRRPGEPGEATQ